ncbi:hypothetical protein ACFT8W_04165 [Streptomyces hygroscopicus]|uniref:hypothetical protein n=1 Tax=Streptomyces hygroscopicus TaxID=1912 RepID=UPI003637A5FA
MTISPRPGLANNWGRWDPGEELRALNFITEKVVRARAAAEVRTGRRVSPAQPVVPTPIVRSPFAPTTADASPVQRGCPTPVRPGRPI